MRGWARDLTILNALRSLEDLIIREDNGPFPPHRALPGV